MYRAVAKGGGGASGARHPSSKMRCRQINYLSDKVNKIKLRNLFKSRWIARAESIRAVWMSYEAVKDTLAAIKTSSESDNNTKASATDLYDKMESMDCVLSIMFMKNAMIKFKQMTEAPQAETLNVVDAMTIIMATV